MQLDGTSEGAAVCAAADVTRAAAQAWVETLPKMPHQQHAPAAQPLLTVLDLHDAVVRTWRSCKDLATCC